jgi:hypothetical protein
MRHTASKDMIPKEKIEALKKIFIQTPKASDSDIMWFLDVSPQSLEIMKYEIKKSHDYMS